MILLQFFCAFAESRRLNKSVTKVEKLEELAVEDKWLVDKTDIDRGETNGKEEEGADSDNNNDDNDIFKIHGMESSDEDMDSVQQPAKKKLKVDNT